MLWVFENRMLRRISGPKGYEVIGDSRKMHSEDLYDLYCSPSVFRTIKSRRLRRTGHVARMGESTGAYLSAPLYRRLGGPQDRSGRVRKISPPPEFQKKNSCIKQAIINT
jgi:hypothetical protein